MNLSAPFVRRPIGTILMTLGLGTASHGSKRWINFPFFNFQPSELGKVLLTLALAGFLVERTRRLGERETTARIMLRKRAMFCFDHAVWLASAAR